MNADFNEIMKTYREVGTRMHLSSSTKTRIKNMEGKMKRTQIGRKIFVFNFAIFLTTLFMIPLTVYGAYQVSQALYEKVRNVDYSQEQIEELDAQLKHQQFSDDDIANLNELKVNEYGQTYGPDVLGSVLVEVISDQGEIGYVYREDLEITEANTINEALQNEEVCRIKVYENDGRTEIGTFTLTDGLDFR
jgi:hypothetical protein